EPSRLTRCTRLHNFISPREAGTASCASGDAPANLQDHFSKREQNFFEFADERVPTAAFAELVRRCRNNAHADPAPRSHSLLVCLRMRCIYCFLRMRKKLPRCCHSHVIESWERTPRTRTCNSMRARATSAYSTISQSHCLEDPSSGASVLALLFTAVPP